MPRAASKPKRDPRAMYVAWETAAVGTLPGTPIIRRGARFRGDSDEVQAAPWLFVQDGGDAHETEQKIRARAAQEIQNDHLPPTPPPPPAPLRPEDAVVAIRSLGGLTAAPSVGADPASQFVAAGQLLPRNHSAVRRNRDAFVDVVPRGLKREDALVAQQTMRSTTDDGERVVHRGQWLSRRDQFVAMHPSLFAPPQDEASS